jgi:peptidoglycan hydrolase CwlO-like protein
LADRFLESFLKRLVGRTDIEDALQRLDKLTQEEGRMAIAEGLKATHGIDNKVQDVGDKVEGVDNKIQGVDKKIQGVNNKIQGVHVRVKDVGDQIAGAQITFIFHLVIHTTPNPLYD